MTVSELQNKLSLDALALPHPEKAVTGGYVGDLLSWVMSGAKEGDAWVTIMSNLNVVAVGSLCDVACVVLASDVTLEAKDIETAIEKEVNILRSDKPAYELCLLIGEALS